MFSGFVLEADSELGRNVLGFGFAHVWNWFGTCLELLWNCFRAFRNLFGTMFRDCFGLFSETFGSVWDMFGPCVELLGLVSELFRNCFRNVL